MDPIELLEFLNKSIRNKRSDISTVILTGGATDYTNYMNLIGQLASLDFIEQETQDFLQKRRINVDEGKENT
jgi:hypothetical protein|tara:strand:+ start:35 stop:250 length:216 start_codon:yes stop_codon:yes gene_type:complete